jgi:hypothetical protein
VSAGGWCTVGGAAGYTLGGPAVVAAGLAAAAVVACAIVVVLRSVLFGGSDPRSPFVRFMLLTCVWSPTQPRSDVGPVLRVEDCGDHSPPCRLVDRRHGRWQVGYARHTITDRGSRKPSRP